jgi:uncharacterized protein (TIGR00255 family)
MTGYGRVSHPYGDKTINVEVRSLNSKYTDVRLRLPQNYREKEAELRRVLIEKLERGKIDFMLEITSPNGDDGYGLNQALFRKYFRELSKLREELDITEGDVMQAILRLPNVVASAADTIDEREWEAVLAALDLAVLQFDQFRQAEGAAMEADLRMRVGIIQQLLSELNPFEEERIAKLRQRMRQNLDEFLGKENIDENRFEQEVLFYLEKIDLTEEKVRLEQHCKYFLEELGKKHTSKGRKLSFIGQEMGREINTMGAKAYSSEIQRLVVGMKDELEKIKEQIANSV